MEYILFFIISFLLSLILFPMIFTMLKDADFMETNFRKERIPIGMGLLFVITSPILIILIGNYLNIKLESFVISFGIISMGLVGLIDDFLGNKDDKGFKGHIKALLKGRLTTGGLKAISGFGIAFLVSLSISNGLSNIVLNTFMIALFTNIINLFDLRPGRACKVFLLFLCILAIFMNNTEYIYLYIIILAVILGYIRKDLKALVMLGDTGSNAMGISLGIIAALSTGFEFRIIITLILVILHVISEFYSFTKIIEKVKLLKFFDDMGRN